MFVELLLDFKVYLLLIGLLLRSFIFINVLGQMVRVFGEKLLECSVGG